MAVQRLRAARAQKQEAASVNQGRLRADAKERYGYLREKDQQRS